MKKIYTAISKRGPRIDSLTHSKEDAIAEAKQLSKDQRIPFVAKEVKIVPLGPSLK